MIARCVSAGLFMVALSACSSIRPVPEPLRYISEQRPLIVEVAYVANGVGRRVTLVTPEVVGDSVRGIRNNNWLTLPVRDIHNISAAQLHKGRTVLFAAALTATAGLVTYAILQNAANRTNWGCEYDDTVHFPNNEACGFRSSRIAP